LVLSLVKVQPAFSYLSTGKKSGAEGEI